MEWELLEPALRIIKELQELIGIVMIVGGILTYAHTRFATKQDVEQAEARAIYHSDTNFTRNREYFTNSFDRMDGSLSRIESRLWDGQSQSIRAPAITVEPRQIRGRKDQ